MAFSKEAHVVLNNCGAIQTLVNADKKTILVTPSASTDGNAILWEMQLRDTYVPRFRCPGLIKQLYAQWDRIIRYRYKTASLMVRCERKVGLLFDYHETKPFDGLVAVREDE